MKQTIKCPKCGGDIEFKASLLNGAIWIDSVCDTCEDWIDVETDALEKILYYFEWSQEEIKSIKE